MKRIIEETLSTGEKQYRVETNRFWFIPCKWHTDLVYDAELDMHFDAVFDNLVEAQIHCGIDPRIIVGRREVPINPAAAAELRNQCSYVSLIRYLDEHRPEDKMSISNGECAQIDKAWKENDWAVLIRYIKKYIKDE